MRLSHLDHGVVLDVVSNAIDIEQVYRLHGHRDPAAITSRIMTTANFAWVAWSHGQPVAVFGAAPIHDGVFGLYLMATAQFDEVILPLTRFVKRTMFPTLFGTIGARRLECTLHEANTDVHRWVRLLGMQREFVKKAYAPDGAAYVGYQISTNPTKPSTIRSADVSPELAAPGHDSDTSL